MPSKKSSHGADKDNKGSVRPSSPLFKEGCDPIETVVSIVEKRARNLSKRKDRLNALQKERTEGKGLDKDQLEAISKLPDVLIQIDFLHDMQKQFSELHSEYQRHLKAKQKSEEKKRKEEEKHLQKSSIKYCLRVQSILNQLDETTKECFRTGSDGAVELTEAELKHVDDFYNLVNPQRPGNASFEQDLVSAVQHMSLLYEENTSKVAGTTYKALHKILEKIDNSGYLDKEPVPPPSPPVVVEEEEDEVQENKDLNVEDGDTLNDFTSLEEVPSSVLDGGPVRSYHQEMFIKEEERQTTPSQEAVIGASFRNMPPSTEVYHQSTHDPTSAPSPEFVGLGSSTIPSNMEFQFMRGDPQPSPVSASHPPPPSFPSTFTNNEAENLSNSVSKQELQKMDGQYVPETGQQMNEKTDLVGSPVSINDKSNIDQPLNGLYNKSQGSTNGGGNKYDRRLPRPNGNNRQKPYGKPRGDGSSYSGPNNRSNIGGGRPRGSGGRGRPNYPYNRPPQNRSTGPRNNTRPQQQTSYASTTATQS